MGAPAVSPLEAACLEDASGLQVYRAVLDVGDVGLCGGKKAVRQLSQGACGRDLVADLGDVAVGWSPSRFAARSNRLSHLVAQDRGRRGRVASLIKVDVDVPLVDVGW